jgi:hypothetical protein
LSDAGEFSIKDEEDDDTVAVNAPPPIISVQDAQLQGLKRITMHTHRDVPLDADGANYVKGSSSF